MLKKKSLSVMMFLSLVLTLLIIPAPALAGQTVVFTVGSTSYTVNGQTQQMDVAAQIVPPGRLMISARYLAQALGYEVTWNPSTQQVTITPKPSLTANTTVMPLTGTFIPTLGTKTGAFDIMTIDQAAHLLYISDWVDKGVDVFDVSTPHAKFVKTIDTGGSGPNGVLVAKNINKLFVGLWNSSIGVIDIDPSSPTYDTLIATVPTGGKGRTDELGYDPLNHKLYAANSDDGFVTVLNGDTDKIINQIKDLGPGLEQPRFNPVDGMMYMTSSDQGAIFEFDPNKDVLVKKFIIGMNVHPNGMAIDPNTDMALLGNASGPFTVMWDFKTQKIAKTFNQVGGGDAVIYNAAADRFFFAASSFNVTGAMGIFSGSDFITNVPTTPGSHTVAFDQTNKIIYTENMNDQTHGGTGQLVAIPLPE